jgi:hypothetical protein
MQPETQEAMPDKTSRPEYFPDLEVGGMVKLSCSVFAAGKNQTTLQFTPVLFLLLEG